MDGKIKGGALFIKRNFQDVATMCNCFQQGSYGETCSIWCPAFGEPIESNDKTILEICTKVLHFQNFKVEP